MPVAPKLVVIDQSHVAPRIAIGKSPVKARSVIWNACTDLVFCAHELQPPANEFPGVTCHYAPLYDDGTPNGVERLNGAVRTAHLLAQKIRDSNASVLITCVQGRNRSAFVAALVLHFLYGMSGPQAVGQIRKVRETVTGTGTVLTGEWEERLNALGRKE